MTAGEAVADTSHGRGDRALDQISQDNQREQP